MGVSYDQDTLYTKLLSQALKDDVDIRNWMAYNYISGVFITGIETGYPTLVRTRDSEFTLPHFMKTHLMSMFSTLKLGVDILKAHEDVQLESIVGHGGLFKTPKVAQQFLAEALESPVQVMSTASEGGAWGIAVLAQYMLDTKDLDLATYLKEVVFHNQSVSTYTPTEAGIQYFRDFVQRFNNGLSLQHAASDAFHDEHH